MTLPENTPTQYDIVSKAFHWIMALLILFMLGLGLYMGGMEKGLAKLQAYNLHKSLGACVLALAVLRILWHVHAPWPPLVATMKAWEKYAARAAHLFLYAAMLGMPLSGWTLSSAAGRSVSVFGFFTLPDLVAKNEALARAAAATHALLAWTLIAVIALHIGAALKHHFIDRDNTLRRMLPFCLALLLLSFPAAAAQKWDMLPEKSTLTFEGQQMGKEFSGGFSVFTPEIYFDPARLEQSKVSVTVDIDSVGTQDAARDESLKAAGWFDVAQFPAARFESSVFRRTGKNAYEADGTLTIRDIGMPVTLPFTLAFFKNDSGKKEALMTASIVLDRSNFQLGQGDWKDPGIVANAVTVHITLAAVAAAP